MLELFDYYRSTASYRVRITLNIKKVPYTRNTVHLVQDGGQQHKKEYSAINPTNLVPSLKLLNGKVLIQSSSIIEYLEEEFPTPRLLPNETLARADIRSIANIIAADIHPLNNLRVLQYLTKELSISQENKNLWYERWIQTGFGAIETILEQNSSNGEFCFGNTPTMADIFLIPQVYNAHRFNCDMTTFPLINSINESCLKLENFHNAAPESITE